jgi:hypothetical protein
MEKKLNLYTYVDGGVNDTPFPNSESPIEIGVFRYDAQRMGGAPVITASVSYHDCLDDVWTDKVYAEFNGEKYYLKQTPTSSYSNEDQRYKHEIELISERVILDNVYFYDSVKKGEAQPDDKPLSNSTKFTFFGDISEFANRLSSSLRYSGVDYDVVVDDGIVSDEKLLTFEDQFFSNVIQESYNTYEIPYYFVGKTIHFGYSDDVVMPTFEYGVDNSLISISKNNLGFKTVNRATGRGSSDNIPFYYPNNSPKGDIGVECSNRELSVKILDYEKFGNEIDIDSSITFRNSDCELTSVSGIHNNFNNLDEWFQAGFYYGIEDIDLKLRINATSIGRKRIRFKVEVKNIRDINDNAISGASYGSKWSLMTSTYGTPIESWMAREATTIVDIEKTGDNTVYLRNTLRFVTADGSPVGDTLHRADIKISISLEDSEGWEYDGKMYDIEDFGLYIASGKPVSGDTITQKLIKYVNTAENLMPSIYRETDGDERFYNAVNGEYVDKNGRPITFINTFSPGNPIEQVVSFDDIKPTIKESTNSISWTEKDENGDDIIVFQRVDMFSEFAYDNKDSDETYEDDEDNLDIKFKHSYFFAKLRKLPFNLFEHAIEGEPMTISFTSGDCGACKFTIGVTEGYPQKNPVQVNPDGTLKRDSEGRVICGVNSPISDSDIQETQQDTINNEVWIALRKEEETYGILMPKAPDYDDNGNQINNGHRPKACSGKNANDGDSFVILGIHLPQEYILSAEEKLKNEIIKYMQENNEEKFSFSIDFSRIYFEENQDILQSLNENSRISIRYNDKTYVLYVSSFSYEMSEGELLPKISVELDESLTIGQNALQNAISEVKSEIGKALSNIDFLALTNPFFIRKDTDDEARGKINFTKGIKFGEGGKVEVMDNNSAKLTIEYLEVTKKASFTSLEIQEKTHVGGQILVTPAAINCGEIEELDDAYRCYFQTKGTDGDEIFNQFAVGDQAICQTYNAWGSVYYWRLVTGVGEDYIDLSKTDCDEDSGIPKAGDKIIQLGNRTDVERQNAIVIAAYGDGSPYIIQYKGINSFEIGDDKIVTKLSSTENIFTGKVHMEMGSDGVENLNLEVGGQNLLRNSGFTGDYLSEQLADDSVLDTASEMFNSPLAHWTTKGNVSAIDLINGISTSGKGVTIASAGEEGRISQDTYYRAIYGESYVVSFKAKSISGDSNVAVRFGGVTNNIVVSDQWNKYAVTLVANTPINEFWISVVGSITLCDLQLERGSIATSWSNSFLDNSSDRAYWQSMKYLQDAMDGASEFYGGLALTETLQVGDYNKETKSWDKITGGVNGVVTNDGDDVAFWAGGTLEQATSTMMSYLQDPNYKPTEEELEAMAKVVLTHGGRAILNDAIVRGTIYAKDGSFEGEIRANKGNFGDFNLVSSELYGDAALEGAKEYDTEVHKMTIRPDYFEIQAYDTYGGEMSNFESIKISPFAYGDRYDMDGIIDLYASKNSAAIHVGSGQFRGLRHDVLTTAADSISLYSFSPYIIILSSSTTSNKSIFLPVDPEVGTTFTIINAYHSPTIISSGFESEFKTFDVETKTIGDGVAWVDSPPYKIEAYFDGNMWYICPTK